MIIVILYSLINQLGHLMLSVEKRMIFFDVSICVADIFFYAKFMHFHKFV